MSIPRFSVRNPVLVNLLTLFLCATGIYCYFNITRETFPLVSIDIVTVVTPYPGVSAEEIENEITIPIENEILDLPEIDVIRSVSIEGRSIVICEMQDGTDLHWAVQRIQREVDRLTDLPEDADPPEVEEVAREYPIISVALTGAASEEDLRKTADDLEDLFLDLDGVRSVWKSGYREREVRVETDPQKLAAYSLSLSQVADALRRRNQSLPAGLMKGGRREAIVRTVGEFETAGEVSRVVLKQGPGGDVVRVADVARVRDAYEDRIIQGRVNGKRSINLTIRKRADGNTIDLVDQIREITSGYLAASPMEIDAAFVRDESTWIRRRIDTMQKSGIAGLVLVLLLLTLFLNRRAAFMTAMGIPVSILGTLILMYALGHSLNMISMFGIIVVLGLLVDDAIVVAENAYRHMEQGMPPEQAAIVGTEEVFRPVLAAVLTSMAAFAPLFLVSGIMGRYLEIIPWAVVLALGMSLVEALFVLPSHLAEFCKVPPKKERKELGVFRRARSFYTYVLGRALHHRYLAVGGAVLVTVAAVLFAVKGMGFVLMSGGEIPYLTVDIEAPRGTKLEETERIAAEIEGQILEFPKAEIEAVITDVGRSIDMRTLEQEIATHIAQIQIVLNQGPDRELTGDEIIEELRSTVRIPPGVRSVRFDKIQHGPPTGPAVSVRLRGLDVAQLKEIAEEMKEFLAGIPGVREIRDDFQRGKDEIRIRVDEEKAGLLGIRVADAASAVRAAYDGIRATEILTGREEIDVRVTVQEEFRNSIPDLQRLRVPTPSGALVPLSAIATIEQEAGLSRINRYNRKRTITVTADVDPALITSVEANRKVRERFANLPARLPGSTLSFGGEQEETTESLNSLARASLVAVSGIYIILATLFNSFVQPLVIMFTLPFAFVGVVVGLYVTGRPLDLMSLIGTIALAGIVVNDSLVLVDWINRRRQEGHSLASAIMRSGRVRMRAILLTTITTIGGLLPISLAIYGDAAFLAPMGIAIIWGLSFATILTLVIIPCVYLIVEDLKSLLRRSPRPAPKPEPASFPS